MTKIYLAGKIGGQRKLAENWRRCLIEKYGKRYTFLNPLERDNGRESTPEEFQTKVDGDKKEIEQSKIVVVYINEGPSWGTAMEIMYAFIKRKAIFVVSREKQKSPWVLCHVTKIFKTFNECFKFIDEFYGGD